MRIARIQKRLRRGKTKIRMITTKNNGSTNSSNSDDESCNSNNNNNNKCENIHDEIQILILAIRKTRSRRSSRTVNTNNTDYYFIVVMRNSSFL